MRCLARRCVLNNCILNCLRYPLQRFCQNCPGASHIDTLEPLARRAEDRAAVQPEARLLYDKFLQSGITEPQVPEVQPQQIRTFRLDQSDLRQVLPQKCAGIFVIPLPMFVCMVFTDLSKPGPVSLFYNAAL